MLLRLDVNLTIDNLRDHPLETVEKLRQLLAEGALVHADPQRDGFYELHVDDSVFYLHVSPYSGKVLLLAHWPKNGRAQTAERNAALVQ